MSQAARQRMCPHTTVCWYALSHERSHCAIQQQQTQQHPTPSSTASPRNLPMVLKALKTCEPGRASENTSPPAGRRMPHQSALWCRCCWGRGACTAGMQGAVHAPCQATWRARDCKVQRARTRPACCASLRLRPLQEFVCSKGPRRCCMHKRSAPDLPFQRTSSPG